MGTNSADSAGTNSAPENAAIELKKVHKRFGDFTAVQDFSVQIRKGEFFSLLGPSGCGKTTTLRMIAGLEEVSGGSIWLDGGDVTGLPAYRRNVNTVFQDYAIFPHMNVLKNVYFPLRMRKIPLREALPDIRRMLQLVNMQDYENRLSQQLSGGQRQRIALARSLVNRPAALLLDEPLGALDFKLRVAMQQVLKDIQRNVGITFVYVTHDQTEALTMSDRIAVMKDGLVHQIGTPNDIYKDPATAFVASFIGDMNFLHGAYAGDEDGVDVIQLGDTVVKGKKRRYTYSGREEVLVCLRSEDIVISGQAGMQNKISAVVKRVVFRGADYEIGCALKNGDELRCVVSASMMDSAFAPGAPVTLGCDDANVITFPKSQGRDILDYGGGEEA
ncbi:MAG: ABC transporter ATP-binding protein [Spirochaetales bacterium]|nr:MAG: ABC transporter ATP-binding protein [Spirochaetales bacterium]